ncbi:MAG: hypothetical protein UX35_C0009G0024 [Microgenomates group bacterium GW2011_GWA1_46_15]|nr:MAG: hypothetical protein UX00_C0017G0006 [Microgenomates group bacterium GW2011_GWB1_45_17]KKU23200.1 MAG: hypothetical protein UX35_C0009G0024 [Microgenomates group bacterium GW2011_GWA1_46_15]KKU24052.1 MAG: hypothetical protein UX36_C0002G0035 [Microgenomates group bacterium GW2011_GWC1_46_15]
MSERTPEQIKERTIEEFKSSLQIAKRDPVGEFRDEITKGEDGWMEINIHRHAYLSHSASACIVFRIQGITQEPHPIHQDWVIIRWDPKVFGE